MNDVTKKTVLAIDDDISVLNTIRTVLEGTYEVSLAKNIEIARTILNTARIDLILLDMNMPDASGMDFLEYLRNESRYYHIPVIIVSSQGTADVIKEAKKRGAVDFVVKPISPNILTVKIRVNLKNAVVKINHDCLERKLKKLSDACVTGNSGNVDKIVENLEQVYFERNTDAEIAGICRYAREMEYNLADEKIKRLLENLPEAV
jgi:putative two-component system response regulator